MRWLIEPTRVIFTLRHWENCNSIRSVIVIWLTDSAGRFQKSLSCIEDIVNVLPLVERCESSCPEWRLGTSSRKLQITIFTRENSNCVCEIRHLAAVLAQRSSHQHLNVQASLSVTNPLYQQH